MADRLHWTGPFLTNSSLALVNRELVGALAERSDVQVTLRASDAGASLSWDADRVHQLRALEGSGADADVRVFHQWPLDPHPPRAGRWVVFQPWEFGALPRTWYEPMKFGADEVWVYSSFNKACYAEAGIPEDKIRVVPLGVHPGLLGAPGAEAFPLRTTKRHRFLFVGGTIVRKGIDVLLDAYIRAFTRDDDVCLVIKDMGVGTFYRNQTHDRFIRELQADPRTPEIEYLTDDLSTEQLRDLYHACDCLVHPYRGEGFGLPIAEAMACGLPVIVPDQGGASDFCTPDTALLVPGRRVPVPAAMSAGLDTLGAPWWVEVRSRDLQERMRAAYEHPDAAREVAVRGRERVRRQFTWQEAARAAAAPVGGGAAAIPLREDRLRQHRLLAEEGVKGWQSGNRDAALRYLSRARERHDDDDTAFNVAALLLEGGDHLVAAEILGGMADRLVAEPVAEAGLAADVVNLLGVCRTSAGRPAEARRHFQQALVLVPGHGEAEQNLRAVASAAAETPRRLAAVGPAVQWVAPIFGVSGFADESRHFLLALRETGPIDVRLHACDAVEDKGVVGRAEFEALIGLTQVTQAQPEIDFVHVPLTWVTGIKTQSPRTVLRTMFESDGIPAAMAERCNRFTEVWVPTEFNRETFARSGVAREKLRVVPGALDPARFDRARYLEPRGDDRLRFLSVFDFQPRKGWEFLLHAYFREFRAGDPVSLVVKASTHHRYDVEQRVAEFISAHGYRDLPALELITEDLDEAGLYRLYANSDAFVLTPRGEGWGRPFMEAMAFGLPTIGTGWSGNTAFMNEDNSYLVEVEELEPCERAWPQAEYYHGQRWARPSIDSARHWMRHVVENPDEARERGTRARSEVLRSYDKRVVAAQLKAELLRLGSQ